MLDAACTREPGIISSKLNLFDLPSQSVVCWLSVDRVNILRNSSDIFYYIIIGQE